MSIAQGLLLKLKEIWMRLVQNLDLKAKKEIMDYIFTYFLTQVIKYEFQKLLLIRIIFIEKQK